ncbi:MAG: hypothetical protein KDB11_33195 [Planctomycetales bacterium]|nr:hypothetical protein [Planctomycetales bacterium]
MTLSAQIASLGEISRRLDVPIHRVEYVIRTRHIEPTLIAGGRHFYSEASVQRIGSEIKRIDEERGT